MPYLDNNILKKAWLESKKAYLEGRGAVTMIDLISYEELITKRDKLRQHLKKLRSEGAVVGVDHEIGESKADWNMDYIDESSEHACSAYLFDLERKATQIYIEEIEILI